MLMDIAEAAKDRQASAVRYILEHSTEKPADLLEQTDEEYDGTALYWVCVNGELDLVCKLLEYGADVNTCNAYKHTPLHAASDMGFLNIVKLLLKYGAKTNLQNENGQTALHLAAYRGYYEIAEALIKAGADHTIRNSRYLTALQESTAMNHVHISALLCANNNYATSAPRAGTKVSLTKTRSHSPKISRSDEKRISSLPTEKIKYESLYQNTRHSELWEEQRHSSFTKRYHSQEHIPTVPGQIYVNDRRPQSHQLTCRNSTIPSQLRVCQPTEHSYYNSAATVRRFDP